MNEFAGNGKPAIEVDWTRFDRSLVQPVTHHLANHPLLQLPSLVALGKRLEAKGRIRTHTNAAEAGTPFHHAPSMHPNQRSAAETLGDIENAGAWMSLLNVQTDDIYRGLVDHALDSVKPGIDAVDPGMRSPTSTPRPSATSRRTAPRRRSAIRWRSPR